MSIIKTNNKTESYIKSFMDNNVEFGDGPSISNYQLESTVRLYEEMIEAENGSICQFATNAGGFCSYHYYKKDGIVYLLDCYIREIQNYRVVSEKWLARQKDYLSQL